MYLLQILSIKLAAFTAKSRIDNWPNVFKEYCLKLLQSSVWKNLVQLLMTILQKKKNEKKN